MVALPMHAIDNACTPLDDVVFQWPALLSRCAHAMSNACRPWVILPAIDQHRFAHKPWQMGPPIANVDVA